MQIKILEDYRKFKKGKIYQVSDDEGCLLIDNGIAFYLDKMMRSIRKKYVTRR